MKFNYKFSNLLGTVYRGGNLLFSPDGNSVFSPVGNKISVYDLKNHRSSTLPVESRYNFTTLALSPSGAVLIAVNHDGEIHIISLVSQSVLHKLRTNRSIKAVEFSPDGRYFAICKESNVLVYKSPGPENHDYAPFTLERVLKGAYDDTTCIAWSSDSKVVAVGAKDNSTRLYALPKFKNFKVYCLGGHNEPIVKVIFDKDSLSCFTVSRNGQLFAWEPSLNPSQLIEAGKKKKKKGGDGSDDEIVEEELEEGDAENNANKVQVANERQQAKGGKKLFYTRAGRHFLNDALPKKDKKAEDDAAEAAAAGRRGPTELTAADYHRGTNILVTGFSNGMFLIHELPDVTLVHSLCISDQSILSVTLNPSGDWIAFGCARLGQLLVWEWQSETYVLKQQGHFNSMACVSYSLDGTAIATGSDDGKVKLWDATSGFCYVTFSEHTAAVTGVTFAPPSGKVIMSASMDGTVRAFDRTRYRNFRTFTSPRPAQFGCLSVDSSGDLVAAGGLDVFEVYLWSVKTGKLLEIISGHDGPVAELAFSPSPTSSALVTVSWDKTLRFWDAIAVGSSSELVQLGSDATAVAFRPDGAEVAVATINGLIAFFDVRSGTQTGTIEGRLDLDVGRADEDLITAKKSKKGKGHFTALAYSADGRCVLAGGQSKSICIYNVEETMLVKKFEVTQNRSFDAMDQVVSRKKLSEFGTNLDLVEDRDDVLGGQTIRLPGAKKGDMSSRAHRPEVRVSGLRFAPTGREFAATTTEGLLIYSLDNKMLFEPFELRLDITPATIRETLRERVYGEALGMALKLNMVNVTREVFEQIPPEPEEIALLSKELSERSVAKLLKYIGSELESTPHIQFYAMWCKAIFKAHGLWIKRRCRDLMPTLNLLHKNLLGRSRDVGDVCEKNFYAIQFMLTVWDMKAANLSVLSPTGHKGAFELSEGDSDGVSDNEDMQLVSNWNE